MEPTDTELVQKCLQGDNRGYDDLVKRYQRQIIGFCYRIIGDADMASDAAQEAFVKGYYALPKFKQEASFRTWLFKIASNACLDIKRKHVRQKTSLLDDDPEQANRLQSNEPTPERQVMNDEGDKILKEAILILPMQYRMPLVLFHFHDMKLKEIAELLDKPEGTIKSSLHIARDMLRRKLQGVIVEI